MLLIFVMYLFCIIIVVIIIFKCFLSQSLKDPILPTLLLILDLRFLWTT